ncbi:MAG: carboxypeptidase-like regulatory domain-containing protein [Chloroflexota bacterium]
MIRTISVQLLTTLMLLSCGKIPEVVNNEGKISGYVRDDRWKELSDVIVKACGPYGESTAVTNSEGFYEFSGMGNGSYYLEFSRNDLGIRRMYNLRIFSGEAVKADMTLYALPGSFRMPVFKRAYIGSRPRSFPAENWICIETNVTSINRERYNYGFDIVLFLSRNQDVTIDRYDVIFPQWDGMFWDDPIILYLYPSRLPFKKGEEIYVVGYAGNKNENPDKLDPYTGKPEFSTFDRARHTNIVSFSMP